MENTKGIYPWVVLVLFFFILFFGTIAGQCMPPLFSEIMQEIPLSKTQMGIVMSMFVVASIFTAPILGALSDKVGCRWVIGISGIVVAAAGGMRYFADSAIAIFVCMFFIGAGYGAFMTLFPKVLGSWFPPEKMGTVNAICMTALGLGMAIAMGTSASILSPAFNGWRGAVAFLAVICFIMAVLWMIVYRDRQVEADGSGDGENMLTSFKKVFKVRDVWLLSLFNGLLLTSLMALISLLPITLEERGMSNAGGIVSAMMFASLIGSVAGGIVSDKTGKRKIFIIVGGVVTGLCTPFLIMFSSVPMIIIMLVIMGVFSGPVGPIMYSAIVEVKGVGTSLAGTSVGFINMIGTVGGFVGPIIAGSLMDLSGSPVPGFIFMALAVIVGGLLVIPSKLN